MKKWGLLGVLFFACSANAQSLKLNYFLEFTPLLGLSLPYKVSGTPGNMSLIGLKSSYGLPVGSVELGTFIQHNDPDRIYSSTLGYRYEVPITPIVGFAAAGYHFSYYKLVVEGRDIPEDGLAETGWNLGPFLGGGLLLPTSDSLSVRLGMYYFYNPEYSLVLEAGLGYRF